MGRQICKSCRHECEANRFGQTKMCPKCGSRNVERIQEAVAASPLQNSRGALHSGIPGRVMSVPEQLHLELKRAVSEDGGDLAHLETLIERCKTYTDGASALYGARRVCFFQWRTLAKVLDEAIKAWQPPSEGTEPGVAPDEALPAATVTTQAPQRRWWQFWARQVTTAPADDGRWIRCPTCGGLAQPGGAYAGFWCNSCSSVVQSPSAAPPGTRQPQDAGSSALSQQSRVSEWSKGKPNPTSNQVSRSLTGVRFLCPKCSAPNHVSDGRIKDVAGALVKCECGNISHVPAAYKTRADLPGLAVHGGVRVPIAEFADWMFAHPSFLTADGHHVRPDTALLGNYGLWGFCAGCHHQYASTVLSILPTVNYLGAKTLVNVHSAESGEDVEALSKKRCLRCGNSNLIAIMVDIPKYVHDAIDGEKRKRGL